MPTDEELQDEGTRTRLAALQGRNVSFATMEELARAIAVGRFVLRSMEGTEDTAEQSRGRKNFKAFKKQRVAGSKENRDVKK